MKKLITDQQDWERIVTWVNNGLQHKVKIDNIVGAVGIERDGKLVGGTTLVNSNGINAYIQVRMSTPQSMTIGLIEKTFHHAFVTLKLKRISNAIVGNNIASINLTRKIGFELEGILREITEDGENIYLSVMRPDICKYLRCDYA